MAQPRWISHPGVDSPAMLGAALRSASRDKALWDDMGLYGTLTIIKHQSEYGTPQDIPALRSVHCQGGPLCQRCSSGRGGYVFRWLSPLWAQEYAATARPGAWKPGEGEDAPAPDGFRGQRFTPTGQLQ